MLSFSVRKYCLSVEISKTVKRNKNNVTGETALEN
jgi:hypothetical protein